MNSSNIFRRDFLKSELVDESWIGLDEALWMTDVLIHENARNLYGL